MIYIIIAVLSGVTIVTSRSINYVLAEKIGMYQSTFFNYVLGLMGSILLVLITWKSVILFSPQVNNTSWIAYTGGLLGVAVVTLSSFLSSKVSSFYLTLLLFVGQLFTGILIDFVVSGYISIYQVIGGILVIIGLGYNMLLDKN